MEPFKILNDRYYLLTVVRRGGFGTVYKGRDSVLGKDVAVKEINPDLVHDAWFVERFRNEARHVAKLNHQNIVHIFDLVESDDGQYYIVMEYIDGLDVGTLLNEARSASTRLPQHLAVHIVAETCKALDYAHNCRDFDSNEPLNLVHQDISPGNIMVSNAGAVKLIDFGIAGAPKPSAVDDDTVTLQGKVQYMAPEQVSVEAQLDRRSDIFSLGLVLYELLEGSRYFQEEDPGQIVEILGNGKLKLKELSQTSKPLQKVLGKALEKSPDKRYQNANQFYIDLVTYLALNSDASDYGAELSEFVAGLSGSNGPNGHLAPAQDLAEPDVLFESVQADIAAAGTEDVLPEPADEILGEGEIDEIAGDTAVAQTLSTEPVAATPARPVVSPEYVEAGDEIKTVIDVVRLSTRGRKKAVKRGLVAAAVIALLFFVFDIFFQWTALGGGIYDNLFPPTIRVASVPAGAKVFVNDEAVPGVTPLDIDDIEPGVYELKLTLDQYDPIVKSLRVPGKGQAEIKGEDLRSSSQPYTFSFKTTLELESVPPQAEVYLNGIKFGLRTPCSVTWEVGEPCEIRMTREGFSELAGFKLVGDSMREEIDDHRLWRFEAVGDSKVRYRIRGLFGKFIVAKSTPSRAAIYLDGANKPIGKTGENNQLFLTAGTHKIVLKKQGYNPRTLNLTVKDASAETVSAMLTRPVRFTAHDATNGANKDLGASLKRLIRDGKTVSSGKRTPFTLNLQPRQYTAIFSKPGFNDVSVDISPKDRAVTASLEPAETKFSIVVLDQASRRPLSNVEVRLRPLDKTDVPESVDVTDLDGTVSGQVEPGLYLIRTSKADYEYQEQSIAIRSGEITLIEFNLAKN